MCTVVLLRRPGTAWPLLLAANRDELKSRLWRAPARHWPDRPDVVAGLDELGRGSWLGINDYGVVAAVLNRTGTLGPLAGKRSRGELVLEALDHADATAAAAALTDLDPAAYRPFNLIVADHRDAYWLRHAGALPSFAFRTRGGDLRLVEPIQLPGAVLRPQRDAGTGIECQPIAAGLSMLTARELNDPTSARIQHYLGQFRAAAVPDPARADWQAWVRLLGDRHGADGDPRDAMAIVTESDYGTVCSSLVALPAAGPPRMWFAPGLPGEAPFEAIAG
jgi:Transport and Golgi organisation 2